jgi:hypothetical protein
VTAEGQAATEGYFQVIEERQTAKEGLFKVKED